MGNETVAKLKKIRAAAQAFWEEKGIELQDPSQFTRARKMAHFWLLVGKNFARNRCPVRASALAYTTLLALIPLLAVVIGVSTSFLKSQGEKPIDEFIDKLVENVAPQLNLTKVVTQTGSGPERQDMGENRREMVRHISEYIGNIRSGALGVTGVISLILVAILLLSNIEETFNDIWGAPRGRSYFARTVYYWAVITLGPIIILVAVGLTSGPYFEASKRLLDAIPLGRWLFRLLPFLVLICGFALFYVLMPNTRVQWRAALVGGAVSGFLWEMNSLFSVLYVSRVVTYSKIYGSLSTVPVFLVGLYFSWLILLFGAQVAYAYQNRQAYLLQKQAESVNQVGREFIALRLMTCVGQLFNRGGPVPTVLDLSEMLGVTSHLVSQVLHILVNAKLLLEVNVGETAYTPARPLPQITCQDILQALRLGQGAELPTRDEPHRAIVRDQFEQIRKAEQQAAATVTLQALVDRLP